MRQVSVFDSLCMAISSLIVGRTGWCWWWWWCNFLGVISSYLDRLWSPALDPPSVQSGPQTINTGIHHIHYTTPEPGTRQSYDQDKPTYLGSALFYWHNQLGNGKHHIDKAMLPRGFPSSLPPRYWLGISPENESCKWQARSCDVMRPGSYHG